MRTDFVFPKLRLVVFVDGCFWHGCPQHAPPPKGNAAFWRKKFAANQARDRLVTRALRRANWSVLRIWEHELARKNEARLLRRIRRALNAGSLTALSRNDSIQGSARVSRAVSGVAPKTG